MDPTPTPLAKPRTGILLVDDDPDDLLALEATLAPLHLETKRACDGVEALRLLLDRNFAVVIMDLMMPRLNGFETGALIRQREITRDLPIVILTGFDADGMRAMPGFDAEAFDYMSKPVSAEALRAKVIDCIARNSGRAPTG